MSGDMKAEIIVDEPNFLLQAMQLMDSFYNREPGEDTAGWINRPLVKRKNNFTMPESEINAAFSDVADYLRLIRGEAAACLEGSDSLREIFSLAELDEKGEAKEYFLSVALLMAGDADGASRLSRDDFVKGCLRRLEYLSELPDTANDEEQGDRDVSAAFSMGDVFSKLNNTLFNDAQRMALLRFFQDIDRYYARVREGLEKLEVICRRHYPLVEKRCREKAERYLRQGSDSLPVRYMYRLVLKGETLRPRDPVHLCVTPVMYNSMGLRFVVDQPLNKLVFIGMIYEDLDELKNRQKRRQESTENQLKAIADPTRLSIMRMLSQRPHYVQELADALGLSPATLSHHLKVLLQAMLVGTGIEGRRSYYSLNAEELSGLAADLQAMAGAAMEENT